MTTCWPRPRVLTRSAVARASKPDRLSRPGLPDEQAVDSKAETGRPRLFRFFAAMQCHGHSKVYEALSEGVAGVDALHDVLMGTPGEQRRPGLPFAAVNLLLASHHGAALAAASRHLLCAAPV
jgi:hypothetical protein